MSDFIVTGWKAGKLGGNYRQKAASFAGAQAYCDDAKEKGFMDVRVMAPDGTKYTAEEVDKMLRAP